MCLQTSGCIYVKALKGLKGSHSAGQESCYFGRALRASPPPVTYQFLNKLCGLVTVRGDCGYTEHQKSGGPESPDPLRAGDGAEQGRATSRWGPKLGLEIDADLYRRTGHIPARKTAGERVQRTEDGRAVRSGSRRAH